MFSKLYLTLKAKKQFDDNIIDPISFILIDWGVDDYLINWDIYPDRAKLEISLEDDNYHHYDITYQGMQNIMDLCFEYEFVMTIIDNDNKSEIYTTYFSDYDTTTFESETEDAIM